MVGSGRSCPCHPLPRAPKTIADPIHDDTNDSIDGWQVVTKNPNELGLIRLFREIFERNPPFLQRLHVNRSVCSPFVDERMPVCSNRGTRKVERHTVRHNAYGWSPHSK